MIKVRLRYDPFKLVYEHGDTVTTLHMLQFLSMLETMKAKDLLLDLLKSQMPTGGFSSKFQKETEGVRETCRNALLLLMCEIPSDQLNVQSAVHYLLSCQSDTGGWTENPDLTIPEETVELNTAQEVTWLTADIIELLRSVGLENSEPCKKALNWLREMQNPDGGWSMFKRDGFPKSDPDSTAQILFMMREIYGEDDPVWLKGIELYENALDRMASDSEKGYYIAPNGDRRENDIYHLTHLLLSSLVDSQRRIQAGYNLDDERVRKIVQATLKSQREDGGWCPFWTKRSDPTYTVLALKLLVWLGAVEQEELRGKARNHISRE